MLLLSFILVARSATVKRQFTCDYQQDCFIDLDQLEEQRLYLSNDLSCANPTALLGSSFSPSGLAVANSSQVLLGKAVWSDSVMHLCSAKDGKKFQIGSLTFRGPSTMLPYPDAILAYDKNFVCLHNEPCELSIETHGVDEDESISLQITNISKHSNERPLSQVCSEDLPFSYNGIFRNKTHVIFSVFKDTPTQPVVICMRIGELRYFAGYLMFQGKNLEISLKESCPYGSPCVLQVPGFGLSDTEAIRVDGDQTIFGNKFKFSASPDDNFGFNLGVPIAPIKTVVPIYWTENQNDWILITNMEIAGPVTNTMNFSCHFASICTITIPVSGFTEIDKVGRLGAFDTVNNETKCISNDEPSAIALGGKLESENLKFSSAVFNLTFSDMIRSKQMSLCWQGAEGGLGVWVGDVHVDGPATEPTDCWIGENCKITFLYENSDFLENTEIWLSDDDCGEISMSKIPEWEHKINLTFVKNGTADFGRLIRINNEQENVRINLCWRQNNIFVDSLGFVDFHGPNFKMHACTVGSPCWLTLMKSDPSLFSSRVAIVKKGDCRFFNNNATSYLTPIRGTLKRPLSPDPSAIYALSFFVGNPTKHGNTYSVCWAQNDSSEYGWAGDLVIEDDFISHGCWLVGKPDKYKFVDSVQQCLSVCLKDHPFAYMFKGEPGISKSSCVCGDRPNMTSLHPLDCDRRCQGLSCGSLSSESIASVYSGRIKIDRFVKKCKIGEICEIEENSLSFRKSIDCKGEVTNFLKSDSGIINFQVPINERFSLEEVEGIRSLSWWGDRLGWCEAEYCRNTTIFSLSGISESNFALHPDGNSSMYCDPDGCRDNNGGSFSLNRVSDDRFEISYLSKSCAFGLADGKLDIFDEIANVTYQVSGGSSFVCDEGIGTKFHVIKRSDHSGPIRWRYDTFFLNVEAVSVSNATANDSSHISLDGFMTSYHPGTSYRGVSFDVIDPVSAGLISHDFFPITPETNRTLYNYLILELEAATRNIPNDALIIMITHGVTIPLNDTILQTALENIGVDLKTFENDTTALIVVTQLKDDQPRLLNLQKQYNMEKASSVSLRLPRDSAVICAEDPSNGFIAKAGYLTITT